jgi:probable F420-dependent oxidoreductase
LELGAADRLRGVGIWASELRYAEPGLVAEAGGELEELGYSAIWLPGGRDNALFGRLDSLLLGTTRATVATGVLNLWLHPAAEVGAWRRGLAVADRERVMLGLGVSHAPTIGEAYTRPLDATAAYLDRMDAEGIPASHRCIGALGPRMLDLARDRSAGAHPYLVTPDHTAAARERLGPGALLAPEQGVILDTDPAEARRMAREQLATYARLPNYRNSWKRQGFTDDDIEGLSPRLVDALFAWGAPDRIAERIEAHRKAGADHVCLQVVFGAPVHQDFAAVRSAWRELACVATDMDQGGSR